MHQKVRLPPCLISALLSAHDKDPALRLLITYKGGGVGKISGVNKCTELTHIIVQYVLQVVHIEFNGHLNNRPRHGCVA